MVKLFLAQEVPTEMSKKEYELEEESNDCCVPQLSSHSPEKDVRNNEGDHTPFN